MTAALTLAWRPLLDPIDAASIWWIFLFPMAMLISLGYKAVRVPGMDRGSLAPYFRQVLRMTLLIVLWMVLLWAAFYLFVIHLLPMIAPMPGSA